MSIPCGATLFPEHPQSLRLAMALGDDPFPLWELGQSTFQCQGSERTFLHEDRGLEVVQCSYLPSVWGACTHHRSDLSSLILVRPPKAPLMGLVSANSTTKS